MNKKRFEKLTSVLVLFGILAGLLAGCVPGAAPPAPAEPAAPTETVVEPTTEPAPPPVIGDLGFVEGEVILLGPREDVFAVIETIVVARTSDEPSDPSGEWDGPIPLKVEPDKLDELNLGDVVAAAKPAECEALVKYLGDAPDGEEWVMVLLPFDEEFPVVEVIERIMETREDFPYVFADPNYATGYPYVAEGEPYGPYTVPGTPCYAEADPHTTAGSPHTTAGSPGSEDVAKAWATAYPGQWAFAAETGIDLASAPDPGDSSDPGVQVAVFDTVPFEDRMGGTEKVNWISPTLTLNVVRADDFGGKLPQEKEKPDLSSHGLSVAGLVHAVAPKSSIQLIEVLNKNATGTLETLNAALKYAVNDMERPDVINMSLGVPCTWNSASDLDEVMTLYIVLGMAYCQGTVVVAAAGNDGYTDTQIPAKYSFVVGVEATNKDGCRACFSNLGNDNVAAPGGDGFGAKCENAFKKAQESERLDYGLVAPVLITVDFQTGYGLWNGTSFAAPLVSGLAARLYEPKSAAASLTNAQDIRNSIESSARDPSVGGMSPCSTVTEIISVDEALK